MEVPARSGDTAQLSRGLRQPHNKVVSVTVILKLKTNQYFSWLRADLFSLAPSSILLTIHDVLPSFRGLPLNPMIFIL